MSSLTSGVPREGGAAVEGVARNGIHTKTCDRARDRVFPPVAERHTAEKTTNARERRSSRSTLKWLTDRWAAALAQHHRLGRCRLHRVNPYGPRSPRRSSSDGVRRLGRRATFTIAQREQRPGSPSNAA